MPEKNDVARLLAEAHRVMEPAINRIIRLVADRENELREPVKLLEWIERANDRDQAIAEWLNWLCDNGSVFGRC